MHPRWLMFGLFGRGDAPLCFDVVARKVLGAVELGKISR